MNPITRNILTDPRIVKSVRAAASCLPRPVEKWLQFEYCILKYTKQFIDAGYRIEHTSKGFRISGHGMNIAGPSAQAVHIAKEVWIDGIYDFRMGDAPLTVIDIGFNTGTTGIWHAVDPMVKEIYAYEPFPTTFEWAMRNIESNARAKSKIKAFRYGLSDRNIPELILPYDKDLMGNQSSITERQIDNFGHRQDYEIIEVRRASEVLGPIFKACKNKIAMKIDCEGAEREILPDLAAADLLKFVTAIIMEYHDGKFLDLMRTLIENGFETKRTPGFYKDSIGMIRATRRQK
ncbi:MAG: FkbM family methyltransferase [Alphaproteobacteria bacterium]|nr:FkbM family methyltransferase [Alphaproteobacteria bacterium]